MVERLRPTEEGNVILTVDFSELERRVLAQHFERDTFVSLGTAAHEAVKRFVNLEMATPYSLERIMMDKKLTEQAGDARLAVEAPDLARVAENVASGLAQRVDRPVERDPKDASAAIRGMRKPDILVHSFEEPRVPRRLPHDERGWKPD